MVAGGAGGVLSCPVLSSRGAGSGGGGGGGGGGVLSASLGFSRGDPLQGVPNRPERGTKQGEKESETGRKGA